MVIWSSSRMARAASCSLRLTSCLEVSRTVFTSCWVMVDPPSEIAALLQVVDHGPGHGPQVERPVVVEALVLGVEHGLLHVVGHAGQGDGDAVLLVVEDAEQRPVGGVDDRPGGEGAEVEPILIGADRPGGEEVDRLLTEEDRPEGEPGPAHEQGHRPPGDGTGGGAVQNLPGPIAEGRTDVHGQNLLPRCPGFDATPQGRHRRRPGALAPLLAEHGLQPLLAAGLLGLGGLLGPAAPGQAVEPQRALGVVVGLDHDAGVALGAAEGFRRRRRLGVVFGTAFPWFSA